MRYHIEKQPLMALYSKWEAADAEFYKTGYTIANMVDVWNERSLDEKTRLYVLYEIWKLSQPNYIQGYLLLPNATDLLKDLEQGLL